MSKEVIINRTSTEALHVEQGKQWVILSKSIIYQTGAEQWQTYTPETKMLKDENRCYICRRKRQLAKDCTYTKVCFKSRRIHHTIISIQNDLDCQKDDKKRVKDEKEAQTSAVSFSATNEVETIIQQTVKVRVKNPSSIWQQMCHVLLYTGNHRSCITFNLQFLSTKYVETDLRNQVKYEFRGNSMTDFVQFSCAITKFLFFERRLDTRLYFHLILKFSKVSSFPNIIPLKSFYNS